MYFLYNLLLLLSLPILPFLIFYKELKGKKYLRNFLWRLCPEFYGKKFASDYDKKVLIHAVSVGEVITVEPFVKRILEDGKYKLYLSTITSTGYDVARKRYENLGVKVFYFPYDFLFSVKSFLKMTKPQKVIIAETELWPNFIKMAKKMGCKVYIVNGRLSDKSFKMYRKFKIFFREVLKNVDIVFTKSEKDAERFRELTGNISKVEVGGSLKFDIYEGEFNLEILKNISKRFPQGKTLIFGSVMEGEEELLLDVYKNLKLKMGNLNLIFAPRHLERVLLLEKKLKEMGIPFFKRSELEKEREKRSVMILDTMGELKYVYKLGDLIFIGGSILNFGGHNPLEPLLWKKTVVVGPHMENFSEIVDELKGIDGIVVVKEPERISDVLLNLLEDEKALIKYGENGYGAILKNRGSTDRIFKRIFGQ